MVDAVGGVTGGSGAVSTQLASTSASVKEDDKVTIARANPEAISPRLTTDPVAGVIIQFLDGGGDVSSQYPSKAAVAYLKAGLSADGTTKDHGKTVA